MNDNHFIETLFPLHIKLQGLYKRVCGDWQVGDKCFDTEREQNGLVVAVDPETVDYANDDGNVWWAKMSYLLRIPRTIDDSSTEAHKRSLWGMVDWDRFGIEHSLCYGADPQLTVIHDAENDEGMIKVTDSPTHAILKALVSQEWTEI
jgi:hypothetical protein